MAAQEMPIKFALSVIIVFLIFFICTNNQVQIFKLKYQIELLYSSESVWKIILTGKFPAAAENGSEEKVSGSDFDTIVGKVLQGVTEA